MSEVWLPANGRNAITVRLESNNVTGRDLAGVPALFFPLELQLLPSGDKGDAPYTLVRLAGTLQNQQHSEFAAFEVGPIADPSSPQAFFRQKQVTVPLDRVRVKRFEDARAGNDANFGIMLSCLLWHPAQQNFEAVWGGPLQVQVPKSHWVERVLSLWNLSGVKVVEIRFPGSDAGESFRAAYSKVEAAEKAYANGQWKQTLAELYAAFESLAKASNLAKPDQQFFAALLSDLHPAKKEKFKLAMDGLCDVLHLGRHEPKEAAGTFAVSAADARFALIMAHAKFEYITASA
jgi:hypothetical protein